MHDTLRYMQECCEINTREQVFNETFIVFVAATFMKQIFPLNHFMEI